MREKTIEQAAGNATFPRTVYEFFQKADDQDPDSDVFLYPATGNSVWSLRLTKAQFETLGSPEVIDGGKILGLYNKGKL